MRDERLLLAFKNSEEYRRMLVEFGYLTADANNEVDVLHEEDGEMPRSVFFLKILEFFFSFSERMKTSDMVSTNSGSLAEIAALS